MSFSYNNNIPAAPNNPSNDQPLMQTNTNSIFSLVKVDHVGFNDSPSGYHTVIHSVPVGSNPPAAVAGVGELYTFTLNSTGNTDTALFYQSGGGRWAQLTPNIGGGGNMVNNGGNGYSFLPGGMIIEWGNSLLKPNGTLTEITFPLKFPNNLWSITLGYQNTSTSTANQSVFIHDSATDKFHVSQTSSSAANSIYWMAIGN